MDAVNLLKAEHHAVEDLFKKFEEAGPRAHKAKQRLVAKMIEALAAHAAIEEQVFYPAVRHAVADVGDEVLESLEEHHIVKWTLSELQDMPPDHERFQPKVSVLMEMVRHHVKEEESDLFPQVSRALPAGQLEELGAALAEARKSAPTRAHPRSPDQPPANLVAGPAAGAMDRARKAGQAAIKRARGKG